MKTFLFFMLLLCDRLTNYTVYLEKNVFMGKKILCIDSNPKYLVEDAECSIKLMNRTHQRYSVSYRLHPNVTINPFYVSLKICRILHFIQIGNYNEIIIFYVCVKLHFTYSIQVD